MSRPFRVVLAAMTVAAMSGAATAASAPAITASAAWARPTPPGATTGAVYVVFSNRGAVGDALVSLSSPAAAQAQIHVMSMVGGVMHMAPVGDPMPISSHGALHFTPGGFHIMLIGLKAPLKLGAHVPVTATFKTAGRVTIDAVVANAAPAG